MHVADFRAPLRLACACGGCLAIAGVLALATDDAGRGPVLCPFRLLTGWPCPFCGATRATVAAVSGDPRLWSLNFVWPFVLAIGLVGGLAATVLGVPPGPRRVAERHRLAVSLGLIAVAWLVAIDNRAMITG